MALFILIEAPEGCKTWKLELVCNKLANRKGDHKTLLNSLSHLDTCEGAPKDEANFLGRTDFLQDSHIYQPVDKNPNSRSEERTFKRNKNLKSNRKEETNEPKGKHPN